LPDDTLLGPLQPALDQGLAKLENEQLRLTTEGQLHLNHLLLPLIPDSPGSMP